MSDVPYTQLQQPQYRGPSTSDNYNKRVEENFKDFVVLYNRIRLLDADLAEFYRRTLRELMGVARVVQDMEARLALLEDSSRKLTFRNSTHIDTSIFNSTPFSVSASDKLALDSTHGFLLLPRSDISSLSKLYFTNSQSVDVVPPSLEVRVFADASSADSPSAFIDSSEPTRAVIRKPGSIWERNVVVDSVDADGAVMWFYLKVPTDLFTTDKSNVIVLHPYPAFDSDIIEVAYTTAVEPIMQDSDSYTPLNNNGMHASDPGAISWVPPGGFSGDIDNNAGPRAYYFDPKPVTGLRIKLRTKTHHVEGAKYVYSYGLSALDLRYDKFAATGRTLVRFDAPAASTISNVTDVQPEIWNVSGAEWPEVFSWRSIWETSLNSGVYTETPVPSSSRVWIEVTLNQSVGKASPALSGLNVEFN